jgi:glycosyltransferase involved in cell wall biosynthesis
VVESPAVSVCVLVYNHANLIESTLDTILEQTLQDYEIVVSDDCSTDGTWEVLQRIQAANPRVRAIRTPHNMGMAGNSNFAAAATTGKYIALLHHDDLYRNDLLERWMDVLEQNPDAGFAFNEYRLENSDVDLSEPIPGGRVDGRWLLEEFLFPRWGCPVRGTAMIRRSAWEAVGGMREQFGLLADIDLWMRLAMDGAVGYVPEPLITVRHARPDSYPDIYKETHWSWPRLVYLYMIHGRNREAYFARQPGGRPLAWWWFRWRLSAETAKWICYAALRRKPQMLASCGESRTPYDMSWLRVLRALALRLARAEGHRVPADG